MSAAFFVALLSAAPDSVPLRAPVLDEQPVERADDSIRTQETAAQLISKRELPPERHFFVGASFAAVVQSGRLRGGYVANVNVGVRLPFWNERLGLMLAPGIGQLFSAMGDRDAYALWIELPILATYHERLGPGLLRVGAGTSIHYLTGYSASGTIEKDRWVLVGTDNNLALGGQVAAGYLWPFGPGNVLVELTYRVFPYRTNNDTLTNHGVSLDLGYGFFFL